MYTLNPSYQERGTAYFWSRHVNVDDTASTQKFDFIYDVWKPTSLASSQQLDPVMASLTAVGLVGVANLTRSGELMDSARKSYGTALRLINAALRDARGAALRDTTMLSILILGLFEMTGPDPPSRQTMRTWHEHVHGAAALAKLRGPAQFDTPAGVRMFAMLSRNVVMSCLQRREPMPPVLEELRAEMTRRAAAGTYEHKLDAPIPYYKLLQTRHDLATGLLEERAQLLERLRDISRDLDSLLARMADEWCYNVYLVDPPHDAVYKNICHIYQGSGAANMWNEYRMLRIQVLETVLNEMHDEFDRLGADAIPREYIDEYHQARATLERVLLAVCASVPQHVGLVGPSSKVNDKTLRIPTTEIREPPTLPPAQSPQSSCSTSGSEESCLADEKTLDHQGPSLRNPMRVQNETEEAERFMLLESAAHPIVWPLFAVGMSSLCSPCMKAYVLKRLEALCSEVGIRQAKAVAAIIRNREMVKSRWADLPVRPMSPSTPA